MAAIAVILLRAAISSLPLKSGGMGRDRDSRAAARVLEPGGVVAFTTETHERAGIVLGEKLRYAHSADHVRGALEAAGLSVLVLAPASSRTEAGVPVPGLLVVAGH